MSVTEDWLDSKRLIGPSIFTRDPGALLEVAGEGADFGQCIGRWTELVRAEMSRLAWPARDPIVRTHAGGAMLILAAPEDALFTATEVAEAAWNAAVQGRAVDVDAQGTIADALADEADPPGLALLTAARARGIPGFIDDDGVQIGFGHRGRGWAPNTAPASVEPDALAGIPTALITGTNGKTTTSRLLAAMAKAAGHQPALTSTDGAIVGDEVLDPGDYAGPGGARLVLRHPEATLAVLETARGGLLRRGLAVDHADVAVVTNISEDHLGDGGVNTLEDLAEVKFLVTRVLGEDDLAVLNADDAHCRARAAALPCRIGWFTLAEPPAADGKQWAWVEGGTLQLRTADGTEHRIIDATEAPITLGGAAHHNIANVLAATSAAVGLGLPFDAIRTALRSFGADNDDNAGRGNLIEANGVRVLIDFGHNPDGMQAILGTAARMGAKRIHVAIGQAGDRTDAAIRDLVRAAHEAGAQRFVLEELDEYRRGRTLGEIPRIMRDELERMGVAPADIEDAGSDFDAAMLAVRGAAAGDLVVLFAPCSRERIQEALTTMAV